MLLSTVEYYVLMEFKRSRVVRFVPRGFHSCVGVGVAILDQRACAGEAIPESSLLQALSKKRKITRTGVYLGLSHLTDSGYLTFFTFPDTLSPSRVFVLTEKGAYALNSGVLFKKATDAEN